MQRVLSVPRETGEEAPSDGTDLFHVKRSFWWARGVQTSDADNRRISSKWAIRATNGPNHC